MSKASSLSIPSRARLPSAPARRPADVVHPRDPVAELSRRFARFRKEHRRGARVPAELRAAVLAVLRDGVAPGDLYRACGVSWGQVAAWKAASAAPAVKSAEPEAPPARVFAVTDAPQHEVGVDLELRVGPWAVTIRLADDGVVGRG